MKFIKFWLFAALLVIVSAVSFMQGRKYEAKYYCSQEEKDYQAACVLSDICKFAMDNDKSGEFEELYYDYVDNLDCDPKLKITKDDLKRYYWCY